MSLFPPWDKEQWQSCGAASQMNANSLSGGWFISREFQSYRLFVPSLGLCLPFVLSVESRVALAGLSPVGCAIALVRTNLGSAGHTYPNGKKGCFSLHLHFHCAASVGSHLIFGHKPYCATTSHVLASLLSQWGNGIRHKIPASRPAAGWVGQYFLFPGYVIFLWFASISSPCESHMLLFVCLSVSTKTLLHPVVLGFTGCKLFLF